MALGGELIHPYSGDGEPLSSGRESPPQKEAQFPIDLIVAATSSARRLSLIKFLARDIPVIEMPLGEEEPETTKPHKVVKDKLARGLGLVEAQRGERVPREAKVALLAADTIAAPVALDRNGQIIWKPQSKPRRESDVDRVFRQMEAAADGTGSDTAAYAVSTASGVLLTSGETSPFIPAPLETELDIDIDFLRWINHSGGIEKYKENVLEFHRSNAYTNDGELSVISIMDIAAGFSIPVLTKMGGVASINGVERDDPGFEGEFLRTVYIAGAGIHPDVARVVSPSSDPKAWQFPHRMAEYALEKQVA